MHPVFEKLALLKIVPVVVINDVSKAVPLAKALCDGGLPCAEITFRTAQAADSIRAITEAFPDMAVGAGTILTPKQADEAVAAGAKYNVSPGLNPEVVKHCQSKGVLIVPGVCTPSEVELGLSLGLDALKFFPAEQAGGVNMVKALSGPYRNVKFMPTGGINAKNIKDYLAISSVFACGGSWMVNADLIDVGYFNIITELTQEAVALVK